MKKTIVILLMLMICLMITACDYGPEVEKYESEKKTETTTNADEPQKEKQEEEKPPEIYNDLEVKFELKKTDYGSMEIVGVYKNNSEYAITKIDFKVLLKDNNTTEYIDSRETVLPGETSPEFDFPLMDDNLKESTIEVLEARIDIKDKEGNERHILYDNKLKLHEYTVI